MDPRRLPDRHIFHSRIPADRLEFLHSRSHFHALSRSLRLRQQRNARGGSRVRRLQTAVNGQPPKQPDASGLSRFLQPAFNNMSTTAKRRNQWLRQVPICGYTSRGAAAALFIVLLAVFAPLYLECRNGSSRSSGRKPKRGRERFVGDAIGPAKHNSGLCIAIATRVSPSLAQRIGHLRVKLNRWPARPAKAT